MFNDTTGRVGWKVYKKRKLKNAKATGFNQNIPATNISQSVGVLFGGKINGNYKYYDTRYDFSLQ